MAKELKLRLKPTAQGICSPIKELREQIEMNGFDPVINKR